MVEKYENTLSRFHTIPERHGRTDTFAISISRVIMLTRDKNYTIMASITKQETLLLQRGHAIVSVLSVVSFNNIISQARN